MAQDRRTSQSRKLRKNRRLGKNRRQEEWPLSLNLKGCHMEQIILGLVGSSHMGPLSLAQLSNGQS
jgi:hypothetical protein